MIKNKQLFKWFTIQFALFVHGLKSVQANKRILKIGSFGGADISTFLETLFML